MTLNFANLDAGLVQGLATLANRRGVVLGEDGVSVYVCRTEDAALSVCVLDGQRAELAYRDPIHFFRAFGILLEKLEDGDLTETVEQCAFDTCGVMYDMSQGSSVVQPSAVEGILERMALMGLNTLLLYLEDCYVLEGHPYFGYMRPQYTEEDFRQIDSYASMFGIEVIPCMQTLAHLIDVIKWPAYQAFSDTSDILLVGDERTYQFVEDMIVQVMKPFRTKRIHIGMDEAWKVGRGSYEDLHGPRSKHELMKEHLDRVCQIADKYGLEPMIWSDMFFNTFDETGRVTAAYSPDTPISDQIKKAMPDKLGLVFWEYDHVNQDYYDGVIRRHQEFNRRVYFAGGIYNCYGFGVNYGLAAKTIEVSIASCKRNGVRDTFLTVWGDDNTENNIFSLYLGFQYLAEHCYRDGVTEEDIRRRFKTCCSGEKDDFWAVTYLDEIPGAVPPGNPKRANPSKWLLWQHPMYGLFDKNVEGLGLNDYYEKLAGRFREALPRNPDYTSVFAMAEALCGVLAIKAELGSRLRATYLSRDTAALDALANHDIPELLERLKRLHGLHRTYWFATNKPEGFDITELRYGTQFMWLDTARLRVNQYLRGEIDSLPELEKERIPYPVSDGGLPHILFYSRMVSASRVSYSETSLY